MERTLRGCQVWRLSQWGRIARKLFSRGEPAAGLDTVQDWTGAVVGKTEGSAELGYICK